MQDHDEILTAAQVATDLKCSKAQVYKAILGKVEGTSRLPAISMGRRKLIRRSSLESWKSMSARPSKAVGEMTACCNVFSFSSTQRLIAIGRMSIRSQTRKHRAAQWMSSAVSTSSTLLAVASDLLCTLIGMLRNSLMTG